MDDLFKKLDEGEKESRIRHNKKKKDITETERFSNFRNFIINEFKYIDNAIWFNELQAFCKKVTFGQIYPSQFGDNTYDFISDILDKTQEPIEFLILLELIFKLDFQPMRRGQIRMNGEAMKKSYIDKIKEGIDITGVKYNLVIKENNEILFYPKGEINLDTKIIDKVFTFLDSKSNELYEDALSKYRVNTILSRNESAEKLRKSIEEFLRFKLKNKKSLKENINELQKKLKADTKSPQIRNIILQVLNYLDNYFNDKTKHHTEYIEESELQYLIYQIGILMKYINDILVS